MTAPVDTRLLNTGVATLNRDEALPSEHTVIVLGVARSGTSMVARMLQQLGVAASATAPDVVYEDRELSRQIERGDTQAYRETIRRTNAAHPVWFWKRPSALNHLPAIESEFRNPVYVAVFRDLLAISVREEMSNLSDLKEALSRAQTQYEKLLSIVEHSRRPTLLLSYEKAIQAPAETVAAVARFLDIDDEARIAAAIASIEPNRPAYLDHARRDRTIGHVDSITRERISGWARNELEDEPVTVSLLLRGREVATAKADQERRDLAAIFGGRGAFGFRITPPETLSRGDLAEIEVRGGDDRQLLSLTVPAQKDVARLRLEPIGFGKGSWWSRGESNP